MRVRLPLTRGSARQTSQCVPDLINQEHTIQKQFRVTCDTTSKIRKHTLCPHEMTLNMFEVQKNANIDVNTQPGPSVLPIETNQERKPGASMSTARVEPMAQASGPSDSDTSNPSGSGNTNNDGKGKGESRSDDKGGPGSGSSEPAWDAGAAGSGNAGDDGSGSGDDNNNNRENSPERSDDDNITEDSEDDDLSLASDETETFIGDELEWGEISATEHDPLDQAGYFEGNVIIPEIQEIINLAKRDKGKNTPNLPVKTSCKPITVTTIVPSAPAEQITEAISSDASEPELMASLQLLRSIAQNFLPNYAWERRAELGYVPSPEFQINEDAMLERPERPRRSMHFDEMYPTDSAPEHISTSYEGDSSQVVPRVPSPALAARHRNREPYNRPNRPRPYPAMSPETTAIRAESAEERRARIRHRDRVTDLSTYDLGQGPSGYCPGSEDGSPIFTVQSEQPSIRMRISLPRHRATTPDRIDQSSIDVLDLSKKSE